MESSYLSGTTAMKIGINASFLRKPGTGIGQVTNNVLRTLISNSQFLIPNKYEFLIYCEEESKLDFVLPENFEMKCFLPKWWKRDDVPRKWLWERELAKRAAEDGCDVLLSLYQSATDFHASCVMPHATPVKHVMIVHDIIPKLFPEYLSKWSQRYHWRAVERAIERADHVVAVSEATKNDLIWKLSLPANRISVAYPDAGPCFSVVPSDEDVARVLRKYQLEPGYIYHGGGLEVRKNTEALLRAYAQILSCHSGLDPESRKSNLDSRLRGNDKVGSRDTLKREIPKLVISGKIHAKSNKLATDVKGLVQKLGLEDQVLLLGFVPDEDLPALYKGALFFAYPSLYEGFGLPVLEAMRMGTPVLAAEVSSLPEVCSDAALYCDPADTDSIATGMTRLISDAALRQKLSEKGSARAAQFSYEAFVRHIVGTLA
jgi:glycosyltransferase involved in cell wall biosynthesis